MASSQLQDWLLAQLADVRCLHRLVENEHGALTRRDVDAVTQLAIEKQRLTDSLSDFPQSATRLLSRPEGDFATVLETDPGLSAIWEEIKSTLSASRMLNQRNAKIVELNIKQTRRTLRVLTTGTDKPATPIYGASGKVDERGGQTQYMTKA